MPMDADWTQTIKRRLFEQRVVMVHGMLDDLVATQAAAELMTLDADGDSAVTLRIDSPDGALDCALTLMDVVELMGVPVNALCMGQVGAASIGVVSVCSHRAAMPSTRFVLREPPSAPLEARAREAMQWAERRGEERRRYCERVAQAAGCSSERVESDLGRGLFLGAAEALEYGLVDEICRPEAQIHTMPGPPIGFRPQR
jgi:ATP-dependent Clp protease protease subunit